MKRIEAMNASGNVSIGKGLNDSILEPVFRYRWGSENRTVVGASAISDVLNSVETSKTPYFGALIASLFYLSAAWTLIVGWRHLKLRADVVMVGVALSAGISALQLTPSCALCGLSGAGTASYIVELAARVLTPGIFALAIVAYLRQNTALWNFALLCIGLFLPVQMYLLWIQPKLCPYCVALGLISMILIGIPTNLGFGDSGESTSVRSYSLLKVAAVVFWVLLARNTSLALIPGMKSGVRERLSFTTNVGVNIGSLVRGYTSGASGRRIVMISSPGCDACQRAKSNLASTKFDVEEYQPCSYFVHEPCFEATNQTLRTPTFWYILETGEIKHESYGWPEESTSSGKIIEYFKAWIDGTDQSLKSSKKQEAQ